MQAPFLCKLDRFGDQTRERIDNADDRDEHEKQTRGQHDEPEWQMPLQEVPAGGVNPKRESIGLGQALEEKLKKEVYPCDKELVSRRRLLDEISIDYDALKSENKMLKSNTSMPCNSCVALNNDLDKARDEIALLKLNASLLCV